MGNISAHGANIYGQSPHFCTISSNPHLLSHRLLSLIYLLFHDIRRVEIRFRRLVLFLNRFALWLHWYTKILNIMEFDCANSGSSKIFVITQMKLPLYFCHSLRIRNIANQIKSFLVKVCICMYKTCKKQTTKSSFEINRRTPPHEGKSKGDEEYDNHETRVPAISVSYAHNMWTYILTCPKLSINSPPNYLLMLDFNVISCSSCLSHCETTNPNRRDLQFLWKCMQEARL